MKIDPKSFFAGFHIGETLKGWAHAVQGFAIEHYNRWIIRYRAHINMVYGLDEVVELPAVDMEDYTETEVVSFVQNVIDAGGNVNAVLRFSIQWNDTNERSENDLDAHCIEPDGTHIFYSHKQSAKTGGTLDVDRIHPTGSAPAVENIAWASKDRMTPGVYKFFVHQYANRGGKDGFRAEVAFDGELYAFNYAKELRQNEEVSVANVTLGADGKFTITKLLPSQSSVNRTVKLKGYRAPIDEFGLTGLVGAGGVTVEQCSGLPQLIVDGVSLDSVVTATKGGVTVRLRDVSFVAELPDTGTWRVDAHDSEQSVSGKIEIPNMRETYYLHLEYPFEALVDVTSDVGSEVTCVYMKTKETVVSFTSNGHDTFIVTGIGKYVVYMTKGGQSTHETFYASDDA